MNKIKKTEIIALNDSLTCSFEIKRIEQQSSAISNNVEVQVSLFLPHQNGFLHSDIQFEFNCEIFNESLIKPWGLSYRNNKTMRSEKFDAATWAEAFDNAETYVRSEIKKLTVLLEKRELDLVEAKKEKLMLNNKLKQINKRIETLIKKKK